MKRHNLKHINHTEDKKELLLSLIQSYLSKDHIRMKEVMEYYYKRLDDFGYLHTRYMKQILPYLSRDLKSKPDVVMKFFNEFISDEPYRKEEIQPPTHNLEEYFSNRKESNEKPNPQTNQLQMSSSTY